MWNTTEQICGNIKSPAKQDNAAGNFNIRTLASFPASTLTERHSICSSSSNLYVVTAVEDEICVYKEDSEELEWTFTCSTSCNFIALSDDSCLLLLAEKSGVIFLCHIPTKQIVWSATLYDARFVNMTVKNIFLCVSSTGIKANNVFEEDAPFEHVRIYVLTEENILFKFSFSEISMLYEAIESLDYSVISENMHEDKLDLSEKYPNVKVKDGFLLFGGAPSIGFAVETQCSSEPPDYVDDNEEDDDENVFEDEFDFNELKQGNILEFFQDNDEYQNEPEGYIFEARDAVKISCTRDGQYLVVLNQMGCLTIFCALTQVEVRSLETKNILNFFLSETMDSNYETVTDIKIGLQLQLALDNGLSYQVFELRKFPSFEKIYSTNMSTYVQLVDCKPNQEFWPFFESEIEAESVNANQSELLQLKSISETSPESRLQSLIRKKKFLEAEEFAAISHLDSEVVQKTKIVSLLAELSSAEKTLSNSELDSMWNEIKITLEKIQDLEFIAERLQCCIPDVYLMEKWLSIVKTWLISTSAVKKNENLICQINRNLNKLITFQLLETSSAPNMTLDDFLKRDLLEYILSHLTTGCLSRALLVWKRHKNELLTSLTEDDVWNILEKIPFTISSKILIQFLEEDLFPAVFPRLPSVIDNVAKWLVQRVKLLEIDEKGLWPENGGNLINVFLTIIRDFQIDLNKAEISFSTDLLLARTHKKSIDSSSSIGTLFEISQNLELLAKLKSEFSCKIPLTYFQESREDLIFAVLDRINLTLLNKAIENFALPYTLENNLDLDICLQNYIEYAVQSFSIWWSNEEKSWEDRLIAITNCIGNPNVWNEAALIILDQASVPWSEKIKDILKRGLASNNPRREDFETQAKKSNSKEILMKYELKDLMFDRDTCDPELIHMVIKYIFKLNRPSAVEDAKQIIDSYSECVDVEVHFKYLQFLLISNKLDEMIELLLTLSTKNAVVCCNRLMVYSSCCLEDQYIVKNDNKAVEVFIEAAIYIAQFLKKNELVIDEKMLLSLRCLRKLQSEFQMFMTLTEVSDKSYVERFLESFMHSSLQNLQIQVASNCEGYSKYFSAAVTKISRLSDILLVPREKMMSMLISICLEEQKYEYVLILCRDLMVSYPSPKNAETLMEVVEHFFMNFSSLQNISFDVMIETICHLTATAVTYSDESLIEPFLYAVNLSTYLSAIRKVIGTQSLLSTSFTAVDSYHVWKFYAMYVDKGFQLENKIIVETVTNFMPLLFMERNHSNNAIVASMDGMFQIGRQLFIHMKERAHEIAALRTILMQYQLFLKITESSENSSDAFQVIHDDVENIVFSIMQKIISQRSVDVKYALSLLTLPPKKSRLPLLKKLLKWCATKLHCIVAVGRIGSDYGRLFDDNQISTEYDRIYKKASVLLIHNIKFVPADPIFDSTNKDYGWKIVKQIMFPEVDIFRIQECCEAFDLPANHVLITFLNNLLFEIENNSINCTEVNENGVVESLRTAKRIIQNIHDDELLLRSLRNLLETIGQYSYEILLFIHEELLQMSANMSTIDSGSSKKDLFILKFLKVYKRISPPAELELDQWLIVHPTDSKLPAISKTRLPFNSLLQGNIHKAINPELTEQSLMVWLQVADLLQLSEDELKMIAIKNIVTKYLTKHSETSKTSIILSEDLTFLTIVDNLMQQINDPKMATICASWTAKKIPKGANCVIFSSLAVKYAKKWLHLDPKVSSAISCFKSLVLLHQRSVVEKILFRRNLSSERVLAYAHNPHQLIEYLLEEYCISSSSSVKVCKVALDIAHEVKIDVSPIFLKYFFNWLSLSHYSSNLDETILGSPTIQVIEESNDDNQNLLRGIYLLLGIPSNLIPSICENVIKELQSMSILQRSRFLFCLSSVYGSKVISNALDIDSKDLDEYMVPLMCVSYLESLRIMYSLDMFLKCSKVEVIQQILSSHANSSKALLFCVKMCLEYDVWYAEIWEIILRRMAAMSMGKALEGILVIMQDKLMNIWHSKAFISAWKCVINEAFKTDKCDASDIVSRIYKAILQCPCATYLDIESLWTEIKFSIQTSCEINLDEVNPGSDVCSLIQALKLILQIK